MSQAVIFMSMPPGVNRAYDPQRSVNKKTGKVSAKIIKNDIARKWADYARNEIIKQAFEFKAPNKYGILIQIPEGDYDTDHFEKEIIDACVNAGAVPSDKSKYNMGFSVEIVTGIPAKWCRLTIYALPDEYTKPCVEDFPLE